MATSVELTPAFLLSAGSALVSLLVATWALSRRSKGWDDGERLRLIVEGNPASHDEYEKKGLKREVEDLRKHELPTMQDAIVAATTVMRWIRKGLNAHGSDEMTVVDGVRRSIIEMANIEAKRLDAMRARRALIRDQEARMSRGETMTPMPSEFDELDSEPFEEEGGHSASGEDRPKQVQARLMTSAPFSPDDTGGHRRRR